MIPEAISNEPTAEPLPIPSTSQTTRKHISMVLTDEKAIVALIDQLLYRSGLSCSEVARRLQVSAAAVSQYRQGRRKRPSLWWMVRLAECCGAKIYIEWPERPL